MATSRSEGARRNKAQQNEQVGLWASALQLLLMSRAMMVHYCCPCLHGPSMWTAQHLIRSICTAGFAGPIHNCSANVAYFTPGKPLNAKDVPHPRPNKWWEEAAAILWMLIFFGCAHTHSMCHTHRLSLFAQQALLDADACTLQIRGCHSRMPIFIAVDACAEAWSAWSATSWTLRRSF